MQPLTLLIIFKGRGTPIEHSTGFAFSDAQGKVFELGAADPGVGGPWPGKPAGRATFRTVVSTQGERFNEAGRVTFEGPDGHLDIDMPNPGWVYPQADGTSRGSATWRILGGEGRFRGCTGLATGIFTGAADGSFTDHQVYKLFGVS
jgi:hypothetical protein